MKWSGSKDSQAKRIITYFPEQIDTYYEPFVGGGSVFLNLLESDHKITNYSISDINNDLIGVYNLIKKDPEKLISKYNEHYKQFNNSDTYQRKTYFSQIKESFNRYHLPEDFYFIMRTTTNGMPRYNRNGEFNNSCHFSRSGMIPDKVEKIIKKYNKLFNEKNIIFSCQDYEKATITIKQNDFAYLDPPYENTKGMYFGGFNNNIFIEWVNKIKCKYALSYGGKVNDEKIKHESPNYIRHIYLTSGNSSFRRIIGNNNNSIISESLYLNY